MLMSSLLRGKMAPEKTTLGFKHLQRRSASEVCNHGEVLDKRGFCLYVCIHIYVYIYIYHIYICIYIYTSYVYKKQEKVKRRRSS